MAIYMSIPSLTGSVTHRGFEHAIELIHFHIQGRRHVQLTTGQGLTRDMSTLNLQHVHISKIQDNTSADLFHYFCSAKNIPAITLYHVIVHQGQAQWRIKYQIENALIASHSEALSQNGNIEMLELAYSKIEKSYQMQDDNGRMQTPSSSGFDLITAAPL